MLATDIIKRVIESIQDSLVNEGSWLHSRSLMRFVGAVTSIKLIDSKIASSLVI